ncbi:MAG: hypothetical protein GXO65_06435 [Euryarchaeota archaeon]|nr:hypothetical protein [Euryarchaeota archaeon]
MVLARAEIAIQFDDERDAGVAFGALQPELQDGPGDRGREALEIDGPRMTLLIEGDDRAAFRAGVNTYSRWMKLILKLMEKE